MKKMKHILSMAALVLMGTMMTGCSSEDNLASNPQPTNKDNIVTVTTTIGLSGDDATTRALAIDYTNKKLTKTFKVGDQVALVYETGSQDEGEEKEYQFAKAESQALTEDDISDNGKSATLTFTMVNPRENGYIEYVYPASLIGEDAILDEILLLSQDGTFASLDSKDYTSWQGSLTGTSLPASAALTNQMAIVAFTLKDGKGTADTADDEDITSSITGMTINDGTFTYTITRSVAAGPIYFARLAYDYKDFTITATAGTKHYTKSLTNKTWAAGEFYQQGLLMAEAVSPTHAKGDVVSATVGGYPCAKLYTSATTGFYIMCADEQYPIDWTGAKNSTIEAGGKTFACGTRDQWLAIINACGGPDSWAGFSHVNTKCASVTNWNAMSAVGYWTSTPYSSTLFWNIHADTWGRATLGYPNKGVRLISAFTE